MVFAGILLIVSLSFASLDQCNPRLSVEDASRQASQFVGKVYSINLSRNKKGECYYRVRGSEGTALVDVNSGKLIRFYRKTE
ncbi:curli assembly protein CsgG [Thermocrinis sp.]|uniref:curli assembly protein CsgG n=1 Tax=Thermocrinis sp. TaxID=2024383 RepID=UPI002FDD2888